MTDIIRNSLAVLAGAITGSIVNMGIVMVSGSVIPPPNGVDVTTMEGLKSALPLFEPKHFLFPFLAHAVGTFTGAWVTSTLAVSHKLKLALLIGILFLAGGAANIILLPSPIWFSILDLLAAYIPMAYLGFKVSQKKEIERNKLKT